MHNPFLSVPVPVCVPVPEKNLRARARTRARKCDCLLLSFLYACNLALAEEVAMPVFTPPGDPLLCSIADEVPLEEIRSEKIQSLIDRIYTDHLNGIRFPDRVGPDGHLHWVEDQQYPEYRKNWATWPVRCPWNRWVEMKASRT